MGVKQIMIQEGVSVDHISESTSGHGIVTQSSTTGYGVNPLGAIVAIGNSAAWALPVSGEVKDGWALCNGQTFASLGAGNYNAAFSGTLPTLNDNRFLMGNASVGSTGGSNTMAHTHSVTSNVSVGDHSSISLSTYAAHVHGTTTLTAAGWSDSAGFLCAAARNTQSGYVGTYVYQNSGARASVGISATVGVPIWGTTDSVAAYTPTLTANMAHSVTNNAVTSGAASNTASIPLYFSVVYLMRVK